MSNFNSWFWATLNCLFLLNIEINSVPDIDFQNVVQPYEYFYKTCAASVTCDKNAVYRSINGSCNNLENPLWGSVDTPYVRLGPAAYGDCNYTIRKQTNGGVLPGPRKLQVSLFLPKSDDLKDTRNFHPNQFVQWITHDVTLLAVNVLGPNCCCLGDTKNIPLECTAPLKVEPDDPVYSKLGKTCLTFTRAMTASFNFSCKIEPQIAVNQASSFLDASQLYGHTEAKAASLRSKKCGKLITQDINGKEFMFLQQRNNSLFCDGRPKANVCFDGGDIRRNQHFGLVIYQQMFVLFHNFLAQKFEEINPSWEDEDLYQAARKFVAAFFQIILYRDYLPILLGKEYSEMTGLTLKSDVKTVYDATIMPQSAIEFVGAAFRSPHNQVPSVYYFLDENNKVKKQMNLNENMMLPDPVVEGSNLEEILRGMTYMPGRCPVASYNPSISSFMFHGLIPEFADRDLLSTDIQRGRDLGVIPYVDARKLCGLSSISTFADLKPVMADPNVVEELEKLYGDVADMDLIVGTLLEKLADDAMVGETARCIISDAFYRKRFGDRFFCDVEGQPGSFTPGKYIQWHDLGPIKEQCYGTPIPPPRRFEQLEVIWSLDLTKVFCGMSCIDQLPCDIFMPNGNTPMHKCGPLEINLDPWKCNK